VFYGHCETVESVQASPTALFAHLDRHDRASGKMKRSWLPGTWMHIDVDERIGGSIGTHMRITGRVLGVPVSAEEVVTLHEPPFRKTWTTVGDVRLLIVGSYRMGFSIEPHGSSSRLRVFMDYRLPEQVAWRLIGILLCGTFARWYTGGLILDATTAFARSQEPGLLSNPAH
jgi:hypothetical protein